MKCHESSWIYDLSWFVVTQKTAFHIWRSETEDRRRHSVHMSREFFCFRERPPQQSKQIQQNAEAFWTSKHPSPTSHKKRNNNSITESLAIFKRFVWPSKIKDLWFISYPYQIPRTPRTRPGHSSFWPCKATTLSPGFTMLVSSQAQIASEPWTLKVWFQKLRKNIFNISEKMKRWKTTKKCWTFQSWYQ